MARILAVQPDPTQSFELHRVLDEWTGADIVFVDSLDAALTAIDRSVPDLILLGALIPPAHEDDLLGYLRALPDAQHVQALGIPLLATPAPDPSPGRSLRRAGKRRPRPKPAGCDPRMFACDVATYLWRAQSIRMEMDQLRAGELPQRAFERRTARRWAPAEVPWLASVRLVTGEAELVNISAGGALLWTGVRPYPRPAGDPRAGTDPGHGLTIRLASGEEVPAPGRVVRCRLRSSEDGQAHYEVAFRFDESAGIYVPTDTALARTTAPLGLQRPFATPEVAWADGRF
jgi:hypothetical protein